MNGFDLFKAVNNADIKYIEQAESYARVKTHCPAKAFRLSVGIAAAAALMTVTAGATILTRFANKDSVEKYLAEESVILFLYQLIDNILKIWYNIFG